METNEIDISKVFKSFNNHFTIEQNDKILFSGKYGIGKSYFLQKYFQEKENLNKYNVIDLSPVNYVISSNEDIFDLIKVDVIKKLYLSEHFDIAKISSKVSTFASIKKYVIKRPMQLVSNLSSSLAKIDTTAEALSVISESVIKLIEDFETFEKTLQKNEAAKEKRLKSFETDFTSQRNTYLERNFITQAISQSLKEIKSKSKQENVLIIEDFDRLDPAHIFRILNIFSAHNFDNERGNKFGFDKIIIVCDLNNIKKIYSHFYGMDTDFSGYIDKFYSLEPYEFDNREAITFHLKNTLKLSFPDYAVNTLVEILILLIQQNKLNLRRILKTPLIPISESKSMFTFNYDKWSTESLSRTLPQYIECDTISINSGDVPLIYIIRILKTYFESYEIIIELLLNLGKQNIQFNDSKKECLLKTIALPLALMTNQNKPLELLFNDTTKFDHPRFNFFESTIKVNFRWNRENKYKGNVGFFDGANFFIQPMQRTLIAQVNVSTSNYFNNLIAFIEHARQHNWLLE